MGFEKGIRCAAHAPVKGCSGVDDGAEERKATFERELKENERHYFMARGW